MCLLTWLTHLINWPPRFLFHYSCLAEISLLVSPFFQILYLIVYSCSATSSEQNHEKFEHHKSIFLSLFHVNFKFVHENGIWRKQYQQIRQTYTMIQALLSSERFLQFTIHLPFLNVRSNENSMLRNWILYLWIKFWAWTLSVCQF